MPVRQVLSRIRAGSLILNKPGKFMLLARECKAIHDCLTMSTLIELVSEGASRGGADKIAVSSAAHALTFRKLLAGARGVATTLRDAGLGRGDRVGVWMDKSPRCVQALLGIMWAGGAYVPLDGRAPWRRCRKILLDCSLHGLITDSLRLNELPALLEGYRLKSLLVDCDDEHEVLDKYPDCKSTPWDLLSRAAETEPGNLARPRPDDLAYILYTSGSTGTPKGVVHTHRSGLAFASWVKRTFAIKETDVFSSHAPFHFDLSISDLYSSLGSGAQVRLISSTEGMLAPYLVQKIPEWKISVWYSVPSILISMLETGLVEKQGFGSVHTLLFAGEVFPTPQLRRLRRALPEVRLVNLFGPTETNVCTYYEVPADIPEALTKPISIGRACEHMETFVITDDGAVGGIGDTGILWVRGDNLMEGYWNDPDKTASVLQDDPRGLPGLACCTGDRVILQADGNYKFLGRLDHMVKIRGYRVDLGEVENSLASHPGVLEAIALPLAEDEETALVASVVLATGAEADSDEIRSYCAQLLPTYMVPKEIEIRSALPKTSTGKADRQLLSKEWKSKE